MFANNIPHQEQLTTTSLRKVNNMSEQPGNRTPTTPQLDAWEGNTVTSNKTEYGDTGSGDASNGGASWVSHPAKEEQFTTDTLNHKYPALTGVKDVK
jgi:hypothetical protein